MAKQRSVVVTTGAPPSATLGAGVRPCEGKDERARHAVPLRRGVRASGKSEGRGGFSAAWQRLSGGMIPAVGNEGGGKPG